MSFESERFITEIQIRPCIWNIHIEEYSNRVAKQWAWNEIAETLYADWLVLEENDKTKKGNFIHLLRYIKLYNTPYKSTSTGTQLSSSFYCKITFVYKITIISCIDKVIIRILVSARRHRSVAYLIYYISRCIHVGVCVFVILYFLLLTHLNFVIDFC